MMSAVVSDLRDLYRSTRPDILHTHSSKAGIVGRFAARGMPFAVVHSVHGWGHTPADHMLKRTGFVVAERFAARHTDTLIAVSQDVRDEGIRLGIGDPKKYAVVPEYVDYAPVEADFQAARGRARRVLRLPAEAPVIGWVGRFMPQKDPATLATAAVRLLRDDARRHMTFIGDGPARAAVEQELGRAGISNRAHFVGFRDDVRTLYSAFDVLLHTSLWEGQPRVVQEAIAERVPVVAARVAGTRDLFGSGGVGFEVEPGDAAAFAAQADLVLRTPDLRAPLPADAIAAVAQRNGSEACLAGHLEIYERVLGPHGG